MPLRRRLATQPALKFPSDFPSRLLRFKGAAGLSWRELARRLGVRLEAISIEPAYRTYLEMLSDAFAGTAPGVAEENLQSRARGNVLMALSNKFGWLVLTTGNKSELAVGYATIYGDMAGGFAVIKDLPKGKTAWMFDQTDMAAAKKALGGTACITGNISLALLGLGTAQEVKDRVKELIDTAGKDGGYMVTNGAFFDNVKAENVKAMVETTKEYGVYK